MQKKDKKPFGKVQLLFRLKKSASEKRVKIKYIRFDLSPN